MPYRTSSTHFWKIEFLKLPKENLSIKVCSKCNLLHSIESSTGIKLPIGLQKELSMTCEEVIANRVMEQ